MEKLISGYRGCMSHTEKKAQQRILAMNVRIVLVVPIRTNGFSLELNSAPLAAAKPQHGSRQ
jgi:hypothetical protein